LRVVETPAMSVHNSILIDPAMLGGLYLGRTRIDADSSGDNFKKNLTTLRAEVEGLFHVRNVQGARILESVS
jgi:hypothetical protein